MLTSACSDQPAKARLCRTMPAAQGSAPIITTLHPGQDVLDPAPDVAVHGGARPATPVGACRPEIHDDHTRVALITSVGHDRPASQELVPAGLVVGPAKDRELVVPAQRAPRAPHSLSTIGSPTDRAATARCTSRRGPDSSPFPDQVGYSAAVHRRMPEQPGRHLDGNYHP